MEPLEGALMSGWSPGGLEISYSRKHDAIEFKGDYIHMLIPRNEVIRMLGMLPANPPEKEK